MKLLGLTFHNPYAEIMAGYTALGAAVAAADFDGDGDGFEDLYRIVEGETPRRQR